MHGTNDLARLCGPASHGCVRLYPSHAAALFALVPTAGASQTRGSRFRTKPSANDRERMATSGIFTVR
ncbi:MAG: L,D-transpeptidase [Bradyrhizobium sp.]